MKPSPPIPTTTRGFVSSSPDIIIRPASAKDSDILVGIHRESFPNYWNVQDFNDFFAVPGTYAFTANAPEPVGMVVLRAQFEQADIITIAILPEWRRRGIARSLLEKVLAEAAKLGAKQLFIDVEEGNIAGLALYQAFGFKQISRRKLYYRQKDGSFTDALVMTRKLA